jgi:hypothetical protein
MAMAKMALNWINSASSLAAVIFAILDERYVASIIDFMNFAKFTTLELMDLTLM